MPAASRHTNNYDTKTNGRNELLRELTGEELVARLDNEKRDVIGRIFAYYCSFGDPLNSNRLKSSKFIKFLRDSGLTKLGALQNHDLKTYQEN